jgi:hypothetical protein
MNIDLDDTICGEISVNICTEIGSDLSEKLCKAYLDRTPTWFSIHTGVKVIVECYFEVISETINKYSNDKSSVTYTLIHTEMQKQEQSFEDLYKGYVIKQEYGNCFIGPDTDRKFVSLREHAARFTKKEAVEYIKNGSFCKNGKFIIEDAK